MDFGGKIMEALGGAKGSVDSLMAFAKEHGIELGPDKIQALLGCIGQKDGVEKGIRSICGSALPEAQVKQLAGFLGKLGK